MCRISKFVYASRARIGGRLPHTGRGKHDTARRGGISNVVLLVSGRPVRGAALMCRISNVCYASGASTAAAAQPPGGTRGWFQSVQAQSRYAAWHQSGCLSQSRGPL